MCEIQHDRLLSAVSTGPEAALQCPAALPGQCGGAGGGGRCSVVWFPEGRSQGVHDKCQQAERALPTALTTGCARLPQVSITDYVVFDQSSLFQTIIHATHSVATVAQAPVEKVADKLRMAFWSQQLQCQPSLLGVNSSGVWISSGKNEFHVAKGSLLGTWMTFMVHKPTFKEKLKISP